MKLRIELSKPTDKVFKNVIYLDGKKIDGITYIDRSVNRNSEIKRQGNVLELEGTFEVRQVGKEKTIVRV